MASMHCYKQAEDVCYDDNNSNYNPNYHQGQQYADHGQNHGYGSGGYGTTHGHHSQYSHPDTIKPQTEYYSETTKVCYDDRYVLGKPNSGHNYGTDGQFFGHHQKKPNQYSMGQQFGHPKDHQMGTHQTGYGSYGYGNMGCNEKSGMKLKEKSGYRKKNKDGYGSCSGSDSD